MRYSLQKISIALLSIVLSGCGQDCTPRRECIKSHMETKTRTVQVCIQSHIEKYKVTEKVWCYHYGYSWTKGKFCWHYGPKNKEVEKTKTVCDKYEDKIEEYEVEVCDEYSLPRKPAGCK